MNDEQQSLCARCAAGGTTCCHNSQIFLTRSDVARIATEVDADDFWELAPPSNGKYIADPDLDPIWNRMFNKGRRRRVLRHASGDACHFLTPTGCRLPLDARPLICRLYPFDYNADTIKGVHAHRCPTPECDNGPLLIALLGMNRDDAEPWRKELYREIEKEFPAPGV